MTETYQILTNFRKAQTPVTTTTLSDANNLRVVSISGRGNPKPKYLTTSNTKTDGEFIRGLILEPRIIDMSILFKGDNQSDDNGARLAKESLYDLFMPFYEGLTDGASPAYPIGQALRITREDSSVRQIKFNVLSAVDAPLRSDNPLSGEYAGIVTVQLKCPNPLWEATSETQYTDSDSSASVSSSFFVNIDDMNWFSYPEIILTGPMSSCTLISESDSLTVGAITGSETITIDLRPGNKTIVDQTGAKRGDLINSSSSAGFNAFTIWPEWYIGATTQGVTYSWSGGGSGASLTMNVRKRYLYA